MVGLTPFFPSSSAAIGGGRLAPVGRRMRKSHAKPPTGQLGLAFYHWLREQFPGATDSEIAKRIGYNITAIDDWKNARHDPQVWRMTKVKREIERNAAVLHTKSAEVVLESGVENPPVTLQLPAPDNSLADQENAPVEAPPMNARQAWFERLCGKLVPTDRYEEAIDALVDLMNRPAKDNPWRGLRSGSHGGTSE